MWVLLKVTPVFLCHPNNLPFLKGKEQMEELMIVMQTQVPLFSVGHGDHLWVWGTFRSGIPLKSLHKVV